MKTWFQVALLAVGLCSAAAMAEPDTFELGTARDGRLVVAEAGLVVNRYTQLTGPVVLLAGSTRDCVVSSELGVASFSPELPAVRVAAPGQAAQSNSWAFVQDGRPVLGSLAGLADSLAKPSPPEVIQPVDGDYVNTSSELFIAVNATEADEVTVIIKNVSGEVLMRALASFDTESSTWILRVPQPPPEGDDDTEIPEFRDGQHYIIEATTKNASDEVSEPSHAVRFTVDTTPPAKPVVTSPKNGELVNTLPKLLLSGRAEPGSNVSVYIDDEFVGNVPADGTTGIWTLSIDQRETGPHSVTASAIDAAGNISQKSDVVSFTVDLTPPASPEVISPGNGSLVNTRPNLSISGSAEPNSMVRVFIDGSQVTPDADTNGSGVWTLSIPQLSDGSHTVTATAKDQAGNTGPSSALVRFIVDTQGPDARIESGPPFQTRETSATFFFSALEAGASFECSLDGKEFEPCRSSQTYNGLSEGPHLFTVRALDAAQNTNGRPARHNWNVDTIAPEVQVLLPETGGEVGTQTPTISGTVDDPFSIVRVFIDGKLAGETIADKDSRWFFTVSENLSNGEHTVSAEATDQAGNAGPRSSTRTFIVDMEPPDTVIVEGPPPIHNSRLAVFSFDSPSGATEFECQLDDAPDYSPCKAEHLVSKLGDGHHTLRVRARDRAGNVDPTPSVYEWDVVIHPPPVPVILEPADGALVDTGTPGISGTAVANGSVTVYINDQKSGVALADEKGHWDFRPPTPLEEGEYRLTAEAMDLAGNTSEDHSPPRFFTVVLFSGKGQLIGTGLSCAASGSQPSLALAGFGLLLLVVHRRPRR